MVSGQSPFTVHTVHLPRRRSQPLRRVAAVAALGECLKGIRPDAITAHEWNTARGRAQWFSSGRHDPWHPTPGVSCVQSTAHAGYLALTIWQDWLMVRQVEHIVAINEYAREQYRHRTHAQFHRINVPIGDVFFDVTPRTARSTDDLDRAAA